jgi:hypothetical protein
MQPTAIRRWIRLCEDQRAEFYVHVSPIKNLRGILAKGLTANDMGGNYSGYETSLSGTYVTREPKLIHDHINARMMENGFILVVVQVASTAGVIDEDALDPWLHQCIEKIVGRNEELYDEVDDTVWGQVAALFKSRLGQPDAAVLQHDPDIIEEYVHSFVAERLLGGDGPDPDWWEYAKNFVVTAFPQLTHPVHGARYSLRLPSVGYAGDTRIVAVITVKQRQEKIVKGSVPPDAQRLIDACLEIQ